MTPIQRQIVREELLRSIAWFGLGIVGWPIVVTEVAWLEATALTVLGLPLVTWAVLTTTAIALRSTTDAGAQVRTQTGLSVSLLVGIMLGGVGAVYLVTAGGYPALWTTAAYVAVTGGAVLWYWLADPSPNAADVAG